MSGKMSDNDSKQTAVMATAYSKYIEAVYLKEVDDVSDIEVTAGYDKCINTFLNALRDADEATEFDGSKIILGSNEKIMQLIQLDAHQRGYMSGKEYPIDKLDQNMIDILNECGENDRITAIGIAAGYFATHLIMFEEFLTLIDELKLQLVKLTLEKLTGDEIDLSELFNTGSDEDDDDFDYDLDNLGL